MNLASATPKSKTMPTTFFQLVAQLAKQFTKKLVWRLVFSVITFIVVFIVHTYLMVVVNDTLRFVSENKVMAKILNLVSSFQRSPSENFIYKLNIYMFWILCSNVVIGTIFRIIAGGFKTFIAEILHLFNVLFSSISNKADKTVFIRLTAGTIIGLLLGTFLFNNLVCIVLALFIFLSTSQKEKSVFILALTLIKSDFQNLFKVKNKTMFNMDGFIVLSIGSSLGLIIASIIPSELFGSTMTSIGLKLIIIIAIIVLSVMSVKNRGVMNTLAIFLPIVGLFVLSNIFAFADDTGWTESGKNLKGWINNSGTPQALKLGLSPAALSSLASILGPLYPGFMKDLMKNPSKNPYEYIRKHMTKEQYSDLKTKVKDYNQMGIDAANADAEAHNSTLGFLGSFFEGCGRDAAEIATATKDFTKTLVIDIPIYVKNNYTESMLATGDFAVAVGKAVKGIGEEGVNIVGEIYASDGQIIWDTVTLTAEDLVLHPVDSAQKVGEKLYEMGGLKDIVESTNEKLSATERATKYAEGVIKLWGLVDGAGGAADLTKVAAGAVSNLSKKGASKLANVLKNYTDDIIKAAGGKSDDLTRILGEKMPGRYTKEELKRLFIANSNKEAGDALTKKLVKTIENGSDDEIIAQVLKVQQDKNAMKALNELADTDKSSVIKEFNKHMDNIYKEVDDEVFEELSKKLKCNKKDLSMANATNKVDDIATKVDDVTTKVDDTLEKLKAGRDRDITIRKDGKDLKVEDWEELYKEKLYEKTKKYFPEGTSPDDIMDKLDQTCLNKFDPEAYGSSESAVKKIMDGKTHEIANAQQVGDAMSYKGLKHFKNADDLKALKNFNPSKYEEEIREGMRQLTKQYDNQIGGASKYYKDQIGSKMTDAIKAKLTPNSRLEKAIKLMKQSDKAPVEIEKALKMLDYTKEQVAKDLGLEFEKIVTSGRHFMK